MLVTYILSTSFYLDHLRFSWEHSVVSSSYKAMKYFFLKTFTIIIGIHLEH